MACLSVVLFERVLVWFSPQVGNFYEYDADLGFRVRPNTNDSNAFGFNDRDYPLQKPAGHFRIVVLGDSFSWAGGKDKNYTALLEQRFAAHYGHQRVEVINAGYPMTHTGEQLAVLKKYGLQYQPDLVVLGFFCGNDVLDADPHRKRIVIGGVSIDIDPRLEFSFFGSPLPPGVIFLSTLKKLLVHATEFFNRLTQQLAPPADTPGPLGCGSAGLPACPASAETPGTFSHAAFLRIEKKRLSAFDTRKHARGDFESNIQFVFQNLSDMRALLHAKNIELLVALYPDEFQVNPPLLHEVLATYDLDKKAYDLRLIQDLVIHYLRSRHIPVMDLLDGFLVHSKQHSLYLPRNTHWNEAGNALAADMLFTTLLPQIELLGFGQLGPSPFSSSAQCDTAGTTQPQEEQEEQKEQKERTECEFSTHR